MRKVPFVKRRINAEITKLTKSINNDMLTMFKGTDAECHFIRELPCSGLKSVEIVEKLQNYLTLGM